MPDNEDGHLPYGGPAAATRRRSCLPIWPRNAAGLPPRRFVAAYDAAMPMPDDEDVRLLLIAMQNAQLRAMALYTRLLDARDVAGP